MTYREVMILHKERKKGQERREEKDEYREIEEYKTKHKDKAKVVLCTYVRQSQISFQNGGRQSHNLMPMIHKQDGTNISALLVQIYRFI